MKKGFQPILDYVEGRMSITEFQHLFETDKSLQKALKLPMDKKYTAFRDYNYNVFNFLKGVIAIKTSLGIAFRCEIGFKKFYVCF